jgi:hypothetical protein
MMAPRARYELRVATLLSRAALARFGVPVSTTVVPRSSVYRFRIPADGDPSEVLHRLTECDVQILEIRRCPEPRRRDQEPAQVRRDPPPPKAEDDDADTAVGVVIPFPARSEHRPGRIDPAPGPHPGGNASAE